MEWHANSSERKAFALRASDFHGFLFVCTIPRILTSPYGLGATVRLHVAHAGWEAPTSALRVWADGGEAIGQVSLLSNCTDEATPANIDALGLRAGDASGGGEARGAAQQFTELSVVLPPMEEAHLRICVGLQAAGGDEEVLVDSLSLQEMPPASRHMPPACGMPSPLLSRMASMSTLRGLAVAGSCVSDGEEDGTDTGRRFVTSVGFVVLAATGGVLVLVLLVLLGARALKRRRRLEALRVREARVSVELQARSASQAAGPLGQAGGKV